MVYDVVPSCNSDPKPERAARKWFQEAPTLLGRPQATILGASRVVSSTHRVARQLSSSAASKWL